MMVAITIIFEIPRFALQRYEETEATENSYCYARTLMQKVFLTECDVCEPQQEVIPCFRLKSIHPFCVLFSFI